LLCFMIPGENWLLVLLVLVESLYIYIKINEVYF
jgi:hypothetical protein